MSYTGEVLHGLGVLLAAADLGHYQATGTYPAGVRQIVVGDLPQSGEAIALNPYLDQPGVLARNDLWVQVRTRGSTSLTASLEVTDGIRDALHRLAHVTVGGHRFNLISMRSFARLARDGNGRYQFTQNFQLTGMRGTRP